MKCVACGVMLLVGTCVAGWQTQARSQSEFSSSSFPTTEEVYIPSPVEQIVEPIQQKVLVGYDEEVQEYTDTVTKMETVKEMVEVERQVPTTEDVVRQRTIRKPRYEVRSVCPPCNPCQPVQQYHMEYVPEPMPVQCVATAAVHATTHAKAARATAAGVADTDRAEPAEELGQPH